MRVRRVGPLLPALARSGSCGRGGSCGGRHVSDLSLCGPLACVSTYIAGSSPRCPFGAGFSAKDCTILFGVTGPVYAYLVLGCVVVAFGFLVPAWLLLLGRRRFRLGCPVERSHPGVQEMPQHPRVPVRHPGVEGLEIPIGWVGG